MIFNKIWERYFFREVIKTFLLLITTFYALYVLIDYSSRGGTLRSLGISYYELGFFYLYTFIQRLDILVPFSLLIATIRTLVHLNVYNELVVLLSSGIKLKRVLRPFVMIGIFFTFLVYLNIEFFLPQATNGIKKILDSHFFEEKGDQIVGAQALILNDQSTMIYQSYDTVHGIFFDVYWIRSIDDMYRIKYLILSDPTRQGQPVGKYVDHLTRQDDQIVYKESFNVKVFPEIRFNSENLADTLLQPMDQPLSKLWLHFPQNKWSSHMSDKEAKLMTSFFQKLVMPWLCLLAVLAPVPYCVKFGRNLPVFFIYVCCMFGLVSLYLVLNAAYVLGQSQVIHPFWAIWPLSVVLLGYFSWSYAKA